MVKAGPLLCALPSRARTFLFYKGLRFDLMEKFAGWRYHARCHVLEEKRMRFSTILALLISTPLNMV